MLDLLEKAFAIVMGGGLAVGLLLLILLPLATTARKGWPTVRPWIVGATVVVGTILLVGQVHENSTANDAFVAAAPVRAARAGYLAETAKLCAPDNPALLERARIRSKANGQSLALAITVERSECHSARAGGDASGVPYWALDVK